MLFGGMDRLRRCARMSSQAGVLDTKVLVLN
ncbi:MAG: hypothetical protein RL461_1801, partial [Planctomycetota bacterium]